MLIRPARFQMFSDENKERIVKTTEVAKTLVHYLWIPTILLVGEPKHHQGSQLALLLCALADLPALLS